MNYLSTILKFMPIALMGILTLGTYWMVQLGTPDNLPNKSKKHVPDYTLDEVTITTLGPSGETKYRIVGTKLTHYEDDSSSTLTNPLARRFHPTKPPTTVKADIGLMNGEMSILNLNGNATLTRPAQPASASDSGSARLFMSSASFTILLNEDIVKTNLPVTLEQGLSIMSSEEGAVFDNVHQQLTMVGKVRGRIESNTKKGY
ncbi:LPS export ABC transporter periplasmic protein LptC [Polynucleobacter sp. MWH-Spelu-300-X4]|nr:LPS export ABC transporter periplasmic protein LptC [Polynucleobacter sp. MWH-Spelu-300-X4]